MSLLNGIFLFGLACGSLYLAAVTSDEIHTYWHNYNCTPVNKRPRYIYLDPVLLFNGAILWISLIVLGIILLMTLLIAL